MRILVLLTDAYGGNGGIALYNRNVLHALCSQPAVAEVVALPRYIFGDIGPLPNGLRYVSHASNSKLRYTGALLQVLLERPFDLVICSHMNLLPLAELARQRSRAPVLLFIYGIDAYTPGRRLSNHLVQKVDAIVSIRRLTLERLNLWASCRSIPSYILENAIHIEKYGLGPRREDLVARYGLSGKRVILTLARVAEERYGFDEILEVMPTLIKEMPDLVYMIAGTGEHLERLRKKSSLLGLDQHVVFTGEVPEAEKADHYRLGDIFAMPGSHPTLFDTYPIRFSYLEAMACGLPIVASHPEEHETSEFEVPNIYVDPLDPESIKSGIREGLRRATRKTIPRELLRYSYEEFQARLHEIVERVAKAACAAA